MNFNLIWQTALIILVGTLLLRVAGRKTISQMTLAEAILMISIGTLLITPVTNKNVWFTFLLGAVLVLTLIILEYAQLKFDGLEKLITGKAIILIENGQLNEKNLIKARITVDQLETKLRIKNITNINEVQFATLEASGQLGHTLKPEHQPATKKDIHELQKLIESLTKTQKVPSQFQFNHHLVKDDLFTEVQNDGHTNQPPEHLQ